MKLHVKSRPEEFVVREVLKREPLTAGDYAVYRVNKRLLTTLEVQQRIADRLGMPPSALVFPALKDKGALATQYVSVRGRGPNSMTGEGYTAQFVGRIPRHLSPQDLAGNWFTVTVPGVDTDETNALLARLESLERFGLPNYFDEQRFGSYAAGGVFVGKAILQGDAEGALRAYFSEPLEGDPPEIKGFKKSVSQRWGDWKALFEDAPRSNHRSVLSFLKDHPADFRKALNLITPRLLPLILSAYQSFLWNRMASRLVAEKAFAGTPLPSVEIAGEPLALYKELDQEAVTELEAIKLPLPEHRAGYEGTSVAQVAADVLSAEGLSLDRFKARILERAYLGKSSRPLIVRPTGMQGQILDAADGSPSVALTFFLPPGSYATLVLKVLEATTITPDT